MALLSAILSLLSRKLGDLLQALFGWSIRGLFGRLPSRKETALSVALILSIMWPVLVVGAFMPKVAAWLVAFLPLHEWLGDTFLRVLWIALAVLSPILVGVITSWVAPSHKQQGSVLRTILSGYPLTLGMFVSFLLTFVIVPLLKLHAMAKRWTDEHVFVQIKEKGYFEVLDRLATACEKAQVPVKVTRVSATLGAPVRVLKWFARSGIEPVVASDPRMLRGDGIEVYLYTTDVLIRGKPEAARRIRAEAIRELMRGPVYLTQEEKAQKLEDELNATWAILERHRHPDDIRDSIGDRLRDIAKKLDEAGVAYEDWVILYMNLQRLDAVASDKSLLLANEPAPLDVAITVEDPRPQASTVELVKESLDEAKQLLLTEIALARDEGQTQLAAIKHAALMFGAAFVVALVGLSTLLLSLVLFIAPRPLTPALMGTCLLVAAVASAVIAYLTLHKKALPETRQRMHDDAQILTERLV